MLEQTEYPQGTQVAIHSFDSIGSTYRAEITGVTSRHPGGIVFYIVRLIDKVPGCNYECLSVISSCIREGWK